MLAPLLHVLFRTKTVADTSFLGSSCSARDTCLLGDLPGERLYRPTFQRHPAPLVKRRAREAGKTCSAVSLDERHRIRTFQLKVTVHAYPACKLTLNQVPQSNWAFDISPRLPGSWITLFGMPRDKAEAATSKQSQPISGNSTVLL